MKYKICKLQDDNGKIWYQIKVRGFLSWYWKCAYEYLAPGCQIKRVYQFDTESSAKHHLKIVEEIERSKRVRILECVDYERT